MTIKHHLTDALLMGYSAGNLPEAFNLAVASHISLCDECRAREFEFDAVGGAVLETEQAAVSQDCFANVLNMIQGSAPDPVQQKPSVSDPVFPVPLAEYVQGGLDAVKWRRIGMGAKQAILKTSDQATARLLCIPAGTAVPDHGHNGIELTLVLQGAFEDEEGVFARGDIEVATEEVDHTPIADMSGDCICLAVTDAPLRFHSWLPRLAQPFLRI